MKSRIYSIFLLCFASASATAASISYDQVVNDVSHLASDELEGRKSGSEGSKKAASYIAKRFSDIGLSSLHKLNTKIDDTETSTQPAAKFLQNFSIYKITPQSFKVSIDSKSIDEKQIMVLTGYRKINWKNDPSVTKHHISKSDNFQERMAFYNQQKDNILVTVDPSHQAIFERFKNYFMRGASRFKLDEGASAVVVLSDLPVKASFTVEANTSVEEIKLSNVAGVLPGKSKANEYVLFSSHYDHLGVSSKDQEDKIYNGADDDASGTTAVINLAQYFAAKADNERTLIFVAFTAEEIGGFGSQYFSENIKHENIAAMINIEMIGKTSKFGEGKFWMTGFDRSDLGDILNKNLKSSGAQVFPDPYPKQNLFYRSDNATLARLGVAAHSFSSSQIDKDQHYHQTSDEVATLDLKSMHKVIEGLATAVGSIVSGEDTPSKVDTSKVKPKGAFY